MTIISKLLKQLEFSDNSSFRALMSIGKFLLKKRIHVFILFSMVVYLAVAPGVYARYFVKLGKPAELKINLPYASYRIHSNIDEAKEVLINNQKVFQIQGWAFLDDEPDQTLFDKYLVLNSKDQVYYYHLEPVERQSVDVHFQDLGLEILNSGFRVYISSDAIRSGSYNVGFLFKQKSGIDSYYSYSIRYLIRTPNTSTMESGELPEETMVAISPDKYGVGMELDALSISADKQIQAFIDGFARISITGGQYSRIVGWAFLEDGVDQPKYQRYIVLESDQYIFYYPVSFIERSDIQEGFPELKFRFSGFSVDILEETLPQGVYEIGIVFKSKVAGPDYYSKTPWIISRTSSDSSIAKK